MQNNRNAPGVKGGELVEVTLELDTEPRIVIIPDDLAKALSAKHCASASFDKLSPSARKVFVRQVESVRAENTCQRRIAGIAAKLAKS